MENKHIQSLLLLIMIPVLTFGQLIPEDRTYAEKYSYRSTENPWYWKNRKPFEGYWQQDVDYQITANIDDVTDIIDGNLVVTYYNNSPDALHVIYFHLYQEAFQPGSYLHTLNLANNQDPEFGEYEAQGLGTQIENMRITAINGFKTDKSVTTTQDNTILRAELTDALQPNGSITFSINFKTYFDDGDIGRRMKLFNDFGYKHYDGVHWYPRIAVYDRKSGWNTDQHLGKEFYGNFGSYDVRLTFPENYIVGATGTLVNPEEAMPASLRQKLDIKNFANKAWGSQPSVIIDANTGAKKTWHFKAVNVHDFAWTADPTYRIGEAVAIVDGRQVLCQSLAQEQHAAGWQNAADYTVQIIETFSRDFGSYIWPKIIVADARDGMEYPMLTLDGGFDPYYRDLLIHEVGHMWFFGMLGSNETYRAMLDEGFTQYITNWGYQAIDGDTKIVYPETNAYVARYRKPEDVRFTENYYGYLRDAVRQNDPNLNTHSDGFGSALGHGGGYGHVYYKTAVMLHNLEYVLGNELFLQAMQHYVQQWKVAHPYPEDFRNSITEYTGVDLNWFFDQWMETNKNIDYAVTKVKKAELNEATAALVPLVPYEITFERKGSMQMPLDFIVTTTDKDTLRFHIPNTWFVKAVNPPASSEEGRINRLYLEEVNVLNKWTGWDKLNPTYTTEILVPGTIDNVIIDPSGRLADINKLDNSYKCPIDFGFDHKISNWPDAQQYDLNWRPDLWYNQADGLKPGIHVNGNYFNYKHIFSLTAWYNSTLLGGGFYERNIGENLVEDIQPISLNFSYKTATDRLLHGTDFVLKFRYLDGIVGGQAGFEHKMGDGNKDLFSIYIKAFNVYNTSYLPAPFSGLWNNSLNIDYRYPYKYSYGNGTIKAGLRANAPFSETDFSRLTLETINNNRFGKVDFRTRVFLQAGSSSGNAPAESQLYLAGANPEEYLENKFARSYGWVPNDWMTLGQETNHFQLGGGLNLRGYAGYLGAQTGSDSSVYVIASGNSGAAINMELAFDRIVKNQVLSFVKMVPYVFADAGTISYTEADGKTMFSDPRIDAGIGAAFTWSWWGPLEEVKPLTIRLDLPLFLNRPPFLEEDYVQFRWVVGLNRAF
jgi:hypothetical protein